MHSKVCLKLYAPKPRKFSYVKKVFPLRKNSVHCEEIIQEEDNSRIKDLESLNYLEVNLNIIDNFYEFQKMLNKSIEEEEIRMEIASILQKEYTEKCTLNYINSNTAQILKYDKYNGTNYMPRPKNPIYLYFENGSGDKTS